MFGKLIEARLVVAPKHIDTGEFHIYNPPAELYLAQGWKPVTFTEAPEAQEGYYYESGWEETETEIVQNWDAKPLPDDIDDAEAFSIIFGGKE